MEQFCPIAYGIAALSEYMEHSTWNSCFLKDTQSSACGSAALLEHMEQFSPRDKAALIEGIEQKK